ncbi:MAG: hypothetical protein JSR53_07500, partial [Proteobacteria bacterium]|nr:hypothetical protein [Pseudomonadota bacterium]
MTELILHHYPASPFAHKARCVLGFKRLAWKSVIVPGIMPNIGSTQLMRFSDACGAEI